MQNLNFTENDASVLKSGEDGKFVVKGLDDGTYYLKETKAPSEYNLLASDIKLEIKATTINKQDWNGTDNVLTAIKIKVNGNEEPGDIDTGIVSTTVENNKGSVLPSTGGIGTTIFYVVGVILMLGAGVLLVTKKRMSSNR